MPAAIAPVRQWPTDHSRRSIVLPLAFGIEWFGRISGIPSIIVLIATGLVGKPELSAFGLDVQSIDAAVPIVATVGLLLIVLDGALDIKLRRDRLRATAGAFLLAVGGLALCVAVFATGLFRAVPLGVISSAVAIPASEHLPPAARKFVINESSVSDILTVLVFFSLINSDGSPAGVMLGLIGGGMLSLLFAMVAALGLVLVLMRIDGHIRFIPLLAGLFGLYAAGKLVHLSPVLMVLMLGLALNNPTLITRLRPFRQWLDDSYEATLNEFKILTLELTFAVRGFFFILLGYWTNLSDLGSPEAWLTAVASLIVIYGSRYALLRLTHAPLPASLPWIAPRGLITMLLYLAAKEMLPVPHYLEGTVMLVVLVSATLIAVGRIRHAAGSTTPLAADGDADSC